MADSVKLLNKQLVIYTVPEIENKISSVKTNNPDARLQMSSKSWLKKFGLRANGLDSITMFPKLGFPRLEDFNKALQKPIHSRYGDNLFPRHFREDGVTFNIVARKDRLLEARQQLTNAVDLYEQRLRWLGSDSRRIFGVLEENCVLIVLDIRTAACRDKRKFDQLICALERLLNEQIRNCIKFNMFRVQDVISKFSSNLVPVTKDSLSAAIDWLWQIDRAAPTNSANLVEALIRAGRSKDIDAIYLITEGVSSDGSREVLREKVKQLSVPMHIVAYNCTKRDLLDYFCDLVNLTGARMHTYAFNLELNNYEATPVEEVKPVASLTLRRRVYGGSVGGMGSRSDCLDLFSELEEARLLLSQLNTVISQIPERRTPYVDSLQFKNTDKDQSGTAKNEPGQRHSNKEEYMGSQEWLARFGLASRKLEFYDVLAGVCFKHCDGVVNLLEPPEPDKLDLMEQQDARRHQKLVNARYCDKFAHVRWRDGSLVHVQMSADVHRLYAERMELCLQAITRRIDWLRQGSRELFGTIMEDEVYLLIDTSASMEPHMTFVKDKLYSLIQEQLRHKAKVNFVAFNSKALPWRDRLVEITEENLKLAWRWLESLTCQGSTNTLAALQTALRDRDCVAVYLLSDGRPDHPPSTVLAQMRLLRRVPVHCISFNCADREANRLLWRLASDTGGRFHYFNEVAGSADCAPIQQQQQPGSTSAIDLNDEEDQIEAWESEDIRQLKAEYRRGREYLDKVTKLRDECHRLAWKKDVDSRKQPKEPKQQRFITSMMVPGCHSNALDKSPRKSTPINRQKTNRRIRARNTLQQQQMLKEQDPIWDGHIELLEFENRKEGTGEYYSLLQELELGADQRDDCDWMLKETQEILDRQTDRFKQNIHEEMAEVKKTVDGQSKKVKRKELSLRQWLAVYGLVPQHLTILDALGPTVVRVRPSYVPILDRYVVSRVFRDLLPVSHVSLEPGGSARKMPRAEVRLVNPLAVDLHDYVNRLGKLLERFTRKLNQLVLLHLGEDGVAALEELLHLQTVANKDESPNQMIATDEVKQWVLQSFSDADWPVAEIDIEHFLQEISVGHKYLQQAHDLIANRKKAVSTSGEEGRLLDEDKDEEGKGRSDDDEVGAVRRPTSRRRANQIPAKTTATVSRASSTKSKRRSASRCRRRSR